MKKKIICIVQARVKSSRLPAKILLPLNQKTLLEYLLLRLKKLKGIDKLIIATSKNKEDDIVANLSKKLNVGVYRGDEKNVLKRFYLCSKKNNADIIIRVTADCPLIDIKYISELLNFYLISNYDYINNVNLNYLPDGYHCEIFSFKTLKKTFSLAKKKFDKEHVTSFMWSNPNLFSIYNYKGKKIKNYFKNLRLTIDYFEDYLLIKKIFDSLYKKDKYFSLIKIFSFLKKNKRLVKINKKYHKLQWQKFHSKRKSIN